MATDPSMARTLEEMNRKWRTAWILCKAMFLAGFYTAASVPWHLPGWELLHGLDYVPDPWGRKGSLANTSTNFRLGLAASLFFVGAVILVYYCFTYPNKPKKR